MHDIMNDRDTTTGCCSTCCSVKQTAGKDTQVQAVSSEWGDTTWLLLLLHH
jgi:hypothetical protein